MSRVGSEASLTAIIRSALARLADLERSTSQGAFVAEQPFPMGFDGALSAATTPPQRFRKGGSLTMATATLGTAGSSTTTVVIKLNGTTVLTVSLGSGVTRAQARPTSPVAFSAGYDVMTVSVTTAGTSAADLTVQPYFG